jgi:hypothetical protein
MAHKHRIHRTFTRPFTGSVAVTREKPQAHGNITIMDICRCGAVRKQNVNGAWLERGPWLMPSGTGG